MRLLLSLGSNLPHPKAEEILYAVREEMAFCWSSEIFSSIYRTPAIGEKEGFYYNCVASVVTSHSVSEVQKLLKNIELLYGRNEECRKKGIVPVDIDIVCCDTEVFRLKDLNSSYVQIGLKELLNSGICIWEDYLIN